MTKISEVKIDKHTRLSHTPSERWSCYLQVIVIMSHDNSFRKLLYHEVRGRY